MKRIALAALVMGGTLFAAQGTMSSFNDFDANKDGKITQKEFENAQQARQQKQAASGKMMKNAANAPKFGDIDTNKDGVVDATEFKNHQMTRMQQKPGQGGKGMGQGKGQGQGKGMGQGQGGGMNGQNP
jgi:hypothetical protein